MRTTFLLIALLIVGFIVINRERIYLRDPLAAVYKDEVKVDGAEVFINYSNDVLVQVGHHMQMEEYLVQEWNGIPGVPVELRCLQGIACHAVADHAPTVPIAGATKAEMTNRQVSFRDGSGAAIRITLR